MFFIVPGATNCTFTNTSFDIDGFDSFDVVGNYLYLVGKATDELEIWDVTVPTAAVLKSTTSTGVGTGPYDVRVKGNYAYITYYTTAELAVWDISNPLAPSESGKVSVAGGPFSVEVHPSADYCYVANNDFSTTNNMKVVNVANPAAPSVTGTWIFNASNGSNVWEMAHDGTRLWVTANYNSVSGYDFLCAIDLSTPASPVTLGTPLQFAVEGGSNQAARGLVLDGNYAYVDCTTSRKFKVCLISTPITPSLAGELTWTGTSAHSLSRCSKYNGKVFVSCNTGTGLQLYSADVSNPASPTESTDYASDGDGTFDVKVVGNLLFYFTGNGTQKVYIWCLEDI